jgi:hypothetical protein
MADRCGGGEVDDDGGAPVVNGGKGPVQEHQ